MRRSSAYAFLAAPCGERIGMRRRACAMHAHSRFTDMVLRSDCELVSIVRMPGRSASLTIQDVNAANG